jgi:hypothetical protein
MLCDGFSGHEYWSAHTEFVLLQVETFSGVIVLAWLGILTLIGKLYDFFNWSA